MNLLLRVSNYITRYAPSEKKLREYISKKKYTWDISLFLQEIWYHESLMCDMWIRSFINSSKWEREIREKLQKKWFPKLLILSSLEKSLEDIHNWGIHAREIESKISTLLKNWKSKKIIEMTYVRKYPYFEYEITDLLKSMDDTSWLEKEINRYIQKYDISNFSERQKLFLALQRKWFSYSSVKKFLEEKELLSPP